MRCTDENEEDHRTGCVGAERRRHPRRRRRRVVHARVAAALEGEHARHADRDRSTPSSPTPSTSWRRRTGVRQPPRSRPRGGRCPIRRRCPTSCASSRPPRRRSRTELDSITPAVAIAAGGAAPLPMSVVVKGRYFAIQKFARLLRQSADVKNGKLAGKGRLYTIDSIAFTGQAPAQPGQSTNGAILATLAMNAYTYSAAAPPPAATSTDTTTTSLTPPRARPEPPRRCRRRHSLVAGRRRSPSGRRRRNAVRSSSSSARWSSSLVVLAFELPGHPEPRRQRDPQLGELRRDAGTVAAPAAPVQNPARSAPGAPPAGPRPVRCQDDPVRARTRSDRSPTPRGCTTRSRHARPRRRRSHPPRRSPWSCRSFRARSSSAPPDTAASP